MYEWAAKLQSGQSLWGGEEYKRGAQIVLSEDASGGESQRHFRFQIASAPVAQQFDLKAMRQGQFAMIEIIKEENVNNWQALLFLCLKISD